LQALAKQSHGVTSSLTFFHNDDLLLSFTIVRSRKIFCQLAVKKLGYSGAEVARYLGVTTSAVNRMANAEFLPKVKSYTKLF